MREYNSNGKDKKIDNHNNNNNKNFLNVNNIPLQHSNPGISNQIKNQLSPLKIEYKQFNLVKHPTFS